MRNISTAARSIRAQRRSNRLYTAADVQPVMCAMRHVAWRQRVDLGRGVSFTFFDAGHILGLLCLDRMDRAAETGQTKRRSCSLVISGRINTPIVEDPESPPARRPRHHRKHLRRSIARIDRRRRAAIIEAMKTASTTKPPADPELRDRRTQTVLFYIAKMVAQKQIPPIRTYIDSPMGVEASKPTRSTACTTTRKRAASWASRLAQVLRRHLSRTGQDSRKINNDRGPCVIIASSPTCEFGRILHHLKQSLENPKDIVLFVGFTPYGTLGRRIQDGQKARAACLIAGMTCDVKCEPCTDECGTPMRMSWNNFSHQRWEHTQAFVVHGEPEQAESFAARLIARGVKERQRAGDDDAMMMYSVPPQKQSANQPAATDGD